MVKLSASQWMLPVQGDGEIQRAIRMMQKKVFQMEQELFETSIEDEQLGDGIDYDPDVNVFGRTKTTDHRPAAAVRKQPEWKKPEEVRYYYVLRGKYDDEGDVFFRGYVTKAKYQEQQSGTWKFKGNSSHDCEKLTKWIMDNQDAVDQENKTFRNPDGLFSRKWYSIMDRKGAAWIRPTMVNISELKEEFPELSIAQPKVHDSYSAAKAYVIEHGGILDITS